MPYYYKQLLDRDNLSSHMPQPAQPGPLGSCSHLPRLQQTDLHQFGTGLGTLCLPSHCLVRQPNSYKAQRSIVQMINNDKDNSITKHSIRQYSRTASNIALDSRDHNTFSDIKGYDQSIDYNCDNFILIQIKKFQIKKIY